MEFDFEVIYRACVKQRAADALSVLPSNETDDKDINDEALFCPSNSSLIDRELIYLTISKTIMNQQ